MLCFHSIPMSGPVAFKQITVSDNFSYLSKECIRAIEGVGATSLMVIILTL